MSGWRASPDVAWVSGADFLADNIAVYLMKVPSGEPVVLEGSAALIWEAALSAGETVQLVARASGADAAQIAPDIEVFLESLVAQGLLEPDDKEQP